MKINDIINWLGTVIAATAAIAYLVVIYILINGFTKSIESEKLFIFLLLGAIDGALISGALRFQGVTFAKAEEKNQKQLQEYTELRGKSRSVKLYPIWVMYLKSSLVDIVFKSGSLLATMYFTVSIMIEGIKDQQYFILGIVNVVMFVGLGLMGLSKGYNYYQEQQVPYLQQKIDKLKKEKEEYELSSEIERTNRERLRESENSGRNFEHSDKKGIDSGSGSGISGVTSEAFEFER